MTVARSGTVVVAMDKFRDTATAKNLCDAVAEVVRHHNLIADPQPMSDGGEGFTAAFTGDLEEVTVSGPLGDAVTAPLLFTVIDGHRTAIFEVADVVGRAHLPNPTHEQAMAASSAGVGQAILAAASRGATSIPLGCGGSATSDGGLGCYEVLRAAGGLPATVRAATDVTARFSGARRYAVQKGVAVARIGEIDERLTKIRAQYLEEQGIEVELVERTGAAGGIPAALLALGATVVDGFDEVARAVHLHQRVARASLVITGEGRFDDGSLEGKVTVSVSELVTTASLLVVCGAVEPGAREAFGERFPRARLISLIDRFGVNPALTETARCVVEVVDGFLTAPGRTTS